LEIGAMRCNEFGYRVGISEYRCSLFERFEVLGADEHGGWCPVLGDDDAFVV
jgi:hypothetical protein